MADTTRVVQEVKSEAVVKNPSLKIRRLPAKDFEDICKAWKQITKINEHHDALSSFGRSSITGMFLVGLSLDSVSSSHKKGGNNAYYK